MPAQSKSKRPSRRASQPRSAASPRSRSRKPTAAEVTVQVDTIIAELHSHASDRIRRDMSARYGITGPSAARALGVPMGRMFKMGKDLIKQNGGPMHEVALRLWTADGSRYEARIMACLLADPVKLTSAQMDRWCRDFDNWGIVDTVCFKLFDRVAPDLALEKIKTWTSSQREFTRRAGLALLACVALHNSAFSDRSITSLLPMVERVATDDRNFVKKAVSWALRAIGGRSPSLRGSVAELAERLALSPHPAARWIARDTLKALSRRRSRTPQ